jgi:hypothetical protein
MKFGTVGVTCALSTFIAASAHAGLLGLTLQSYPDITSGFIDVTYNAGTDQFTASGFALSFNDDGLGPADNINNGSFLITATVNSSGTATGGALNIGGNVGAFSSPLLVANLTAFGFQNSGGDLFEFLFTVTGGTLAASHYGGVGATIGVILDANGANFNGSFNSNFNNNGGFPGFGQGVSNTGILVPAPGALAALLMAGLCGSRRRRTPTDPA